MKILKFIGLLVIVFFILILAHRNWGDEIVGLNTSDTLCDSYRAAEFIVIKGTVDAVFEDSENHMQNTVKVISNNNVQTFYLEYDKSGLFEYLEVQDSIIKDYNSYRVNVIRQGKIKAFLLDYGCNSVDL